MRIKNVDVYGLEESIKRSGYPMQTGEPDDLFTSEMGEGDSRRAERLASAKCGSGHDNFLIGIAVQFDLCYPQYWTKHLQRYHWFQYFSGQSLMHKLTSVTNIKDNCNKYVLGTVIDEINNLIEIYNTYEVEDYPCVYEYYESKSKEITSKEECFHYIISNCPMGYELWVPVHTNYLQLKTMYTQRKIHRLNDWKEFCKWIESLPMSELITGK